MFEHTASNPIFIKPIIAPRTYGYNPITMSGYGFSLGDIKKFLEKKFYEFKCSVLEDIDSCKKLCYDYKEKDICDLLCKQRDVRACSIIHPSKPNRPMPPPGGGIPGQGGVYISHGGINKEDLALLLGAGALIVALLALRK